MTWEVRQGDCLEVMATLPENSVDAVVCDPPYGIRFMGKTWDDGVILARRRDQLNRNAEKRAREDAPGTNGLAAEAGVYDHSPAAHLAFQTWTLEWATETFRILKPGGHLIAFGGTRTYHRMACAVEDAGFEIRDQLQWLYGSGFPKSLDISKAIDKAAGAEREVVRRRSTNRNRPPTEAWEKSAQMKDAQPFGTQVGQLVEDTAPATGSARRWQGWGTALKPAHEPLVLARKPLSERNVAANVERWGTGGLNVDGGRLEGPKPYREVVKKQENDWDGDGPWKSSGVGAGESSVGRWPPNVALDEEAAALVDEQSGETQGRGSYVQPRATTDADGASWSKGDHVPFHIGDTGGASRFMYVAKADRAERNKGLVGWPERMPDNAVDRASQRAGEEAAPGRGSLTKPMANVHPTVKPIALMAWLCRLVTPPKGLILDPFCGSGSTGIAALREGFSFLGIEREPEYVEIARARIEGDSPLFNMVNP